MKRTFFILMLAGETAWAASCCVGGSPKTFIQLKRLQTYELGVSTSVRDVYGRYNLYGERESADGNQTYSVAWGAGMRLNESLQTFAVFPLVHQINRYGSALADRTGPGDAIVGGSWTVVEHLFFDDWYPTVTLTAGAKFPTGAAEREILGRRVPGTGNGLLEPFLGLGLKKDFEWITFAVAATFSRPFGTLEGNIKEGNRWELSETVNVPWGRRLSLGAGSAQTWVGSKAQSGTRIADSAARAVEAFATATYFLTPLLDLTGTVDFTVPADRLAVNHPAYRVVTLTLKYGFY